MKKATSAADVRSVVLSWGVAKWLVTADDDASSMSLGEVVVLPGKSHEWHVHEDSDEIIYVLSGSGEFTVGEGNRFPVSPGDAVHIPKAVHHDSHNTGWSPLHLLVMYSPGGPESATPETDHLMIPAGLPVAMSTDVPDDVA